MSMSEPKGWREARMARLSMQYPELQMGTPNDVLGVDAMRVQRGEAPSQFSMCVMRLAKFAAEQKRD